MCGEGLGGSTRGEGFDLKAIDFLEEEGGGDRNLIFFN